MEKQITGTETTVPAAAEAADTAREAAADPAAGTNRETDGGETGKAPAGKSYDQAYIDKLLADQQVAREAAVAEALKVAGMDAKSKADYEKQKAEKEIADREAVIALRELKVEAREVLAENEVEAEFLDMLVGKDLEETKSNVTAFKSKFDAAVQAQVEKRLAGKTPNNGNGGSATNEAEAMTAEIQKYMN